MKNLVITLTVKNGFDLQHDPVNQHLKLDFMRLIELIFKEVMVLIDMPFAQAKIEYEKNFNKFPVKIKFSFLDITFNHEGIQDAVLDIYKQTVENAVENVNRKLKEFLEVCMPVMLDAGQEETSKFKFYQNREFPVKVAHDRDFFGNINETTYSLVVPK